MAGPSSSPSASSSCGRGSGGRCRTDARRQPWQWRGRNAAGRLQRPVTVEAKETWSTTSGAPKIASLLEVEAKDERMPAVVGPSSSPGLVFM
uniref:Uncharacterized protein n=1 Tax=Oryza rufipogon TaxID=4529 RepID=A0A0E0R8R1_ORYRU